MEMEYSRNPYDRWELDGDGLDICINESAQDKNSGMIPKHILYLGKKKVKQLYMTEYKSVFFDDKEKRDFIKKYFPDSLSLYRSYKNKISRDHLFIYLWLYMNGGIYIDESYEINKSLDPIFNDLPESDLYFMYDEDRYISHKFFICHAFSEFWIKVVNLMKSRQNNKYSSFQEQIDKTSGRSLLTDALEGYSDRYHIIPRTILDPYSYCDMVYDKNGYLKPTNTKNNILKYVKCQTGSTDEMVYIGIVSIFIIIIMVIIALITR